MARYRKYVVAYTNHKDEVVVDSIYARSQYEAFKKSCADGLRLISITMLDKKLEEKI